jgi:hypothetical protein
MIPTLSRIIPVNVSSTISNVFAGMPKISFIAPYLLENPSRKLGFGDSGIGDE